MVIKKVLESMENVSTVINWYLKPVTYHLLSIFHIVSG